jgi:TonB family protein
MRGTESWVFGYLLNSLWQLPLIFLAAWLTVRMVRGLGAQVEHRVWVAALLLQVALPACGQRLSELGREALRVFRHGWNVGASGGHVRVSVGAGTAGAGGVLRLSVEMLLVIALIYGCSLVYFAGRLGWGLWRTRQMRKDAERMVLSGDAGVTWKRYERLLGVDAAEIAVSAMISGPVTVGIRRGVMIVPPEFVSGVDESDFDAVAAHELAHMRRRDFAKNVLYEVLSLPVAFHPVMWLTSSRVAESREMVCDAMAAEAIGGSEGYARSLLRLAAMMTNGTPARTLHAIGIFDANIFERRVMNLTKRRVEVSVVRRFVIAAACVAIGVATCASAMAMRMEVSGPAGAEQAAAPVRISAGMIAKEIISQPVPVYPTTAKADKIQGAVVLRVIINKEGVPTEVQVYKGVREDLDQSAVTAVKQWRWKPYLLNGEKTAVQSTVTVHYSLAK